MYIHMNSFHRKARAPPRLGLGSEQRSWCLAGFREGSFKIDHELLLGHIPGCAGLVGKGMGLEAELELGFG